MKKKGIARKLVATLEASKVGGWGRGTPRGILYEYQNKGVVKFSIRKCMKINGLLFLR
jgi:hypothetical protein